MPPRLLGRIAAATTQVGGEAGGRGRPGDGSGRAWRRRHTGPRPPPAPLSRDGWASVAPPRRPSCQKGLQWCAGRRPPSSPRCRPPAAAHRHLSCQTGPSLDRPPWLRALRGGAALELRQQGSGGGAGLCDGQVIAPRHHRASAQPGQEPPRPARTPRPPQQSRSRACKRRHAACAPCPIVDTRTQDRPAHRPAAGPLPRPHPRPAQPLRRPHPVPAARQSMLSRLLAVEAPAWLAAAAGARRGLAAKAGGAVATTKPADDGITTTTPGQAFVGDLRSTSALEVGVLGAACGDVGVAGGTGGGVAPVLRGRGRHCNEHGLQRACVAPLAATRRWATACSTTPRSGCRCGPTCARACVAAGCSRCLPARPPPACLPCAC